MRKNLEVTGGNKLNGVVTPSGNKNSALPVLCASLLTTEDVTIRNIPDLEDVRRLLDLLQKVGCSINWDKKDRTVYINSGNLSFDAFDGYFPLGMRGAILLLAPLLARFRKLRFRNTIGGCALGVREIDPHLEILKQLGAKVTVKSDAIELNWDKPQGNKIWLDYMSVTTTENFLMAAAVTKGTSTLTNAASEPHVQDLSNFLNAMGAKVKGVGTSKLQVDGVSHLHGCEFTISEDHHEVVTMLALGAMTGGNVVIENVSVENYSLINKAFSKLGVNVHVRSNELEINQQSPLKVAGSYTSNLITKIEAAPWPYFPVDLLPLMIALATRSKGEVMFWNKVYEGGLLWVQELLRFKVKFVLCDPHRVIIFGGKKLQAATVNAPNIIRAAVALVMIAVSIEGQSVINNAAVIRRAHDKFVNKLHSLGLKIKWI